MRAVLEQTNWFSCEGSLPARMHAFEASLFMIGYDLRNMVAEHGFLKKNHSSDIKIKTTDNKNFGWVPSGNKFDSVCRHFLNYRQKKIGDSNLEGFKQYMLELGIYKRSTVDSYVFPLKESEFDLLSFDLDVLEKIQQGGREGLIAALCGNKNFLLGEDREHVCLVDVWFAGYCKRHQIETNEFVRKLIEGGFAGKSGAAQTILSVGRNVGKHFGLLDSKNMPTAWFDEFFDDELSDFERRLAAC